MDLINAGSRSMIYNQRDVARGASIDEVKSKQRIKEFSRCLDASNAHARSSVLDDSVEQSQVDDGFMDANEFMKHLDSLQKNSPPNRLLDHF